MDCVNEVIVRVPFANGMTWSLNNKDCWAKYGSSNSTIDPNGCSYCKSCFIGKAFFCLYQTLLEQFKWDVIILSLQTY